MLHSLCAVSSAWTFQHASWVSIFITKKTAGPQKCVFERGCGNLTEVPSLELTYSRFPLKGTFEDVFLFPRGDMLVLWRAFVWTFGKTQGLVT